VSVLDPVALSTLAGFALLFVYASFFEYAFHRWIMHRRWRLFTHTYQMHTLLHHRVFHGDATYQVHQSEDRILFEWWQGPLLLAVHAPGVWGLELASGLPVFWGGMAAMAVYYGLYEYVHWCVHCPAGRWIEGKRVFQYLSAHHRLHHRLWRTNFNVVLPLGDLVFGTLRPAIARPASC
jgi:hypothetical protein